MLLRNTNNCVHHPAADSKMATNCHLLGVLDRDQRTTVSSSKFDDMTAERALSDSVSRCNCSNHTTARTSKRHRQRNQQHHHHHHHHNPHQSVNQPSRSYPVHKTNRWHMLRRALHRFGEVLVVGVCLLSAVRVPPVMSAPLSPLEVHFNSRPKWINPCGLGPNDEVDTDVPEYRANDNELLGRIILQARNALMHAQMFKELYVQKTFNVGFAQWHESWKTNHFDWLPSSDQIPKNLGDPTPEDHLKKLELDSTLKDIYQYLQKYAVGLEQIVWDQDEDNGDFKDNFRDTEFKLRATLCEVQVTMLERSVMQHDDITRGLMTDEFRTIGNCSHRNLRDWFIFRDYMNGLEYVIQVFEYFKQKLTS